eukprot:Sspe_Gene.44698::Locus_21933_Transcript_1_1_Confidence_1.000_Length_855::g.44698::m.44698/K13761/PDE9; high affinity cGMP-specific 3',5'-cyclic phosphodiesterase 9
MDAAKQNSHEYNYMMEANLPVLMEKLLGKVVSMRAGDVFGAIDSVAASLRVEVQAERVSGMWPSGAISETEKDALCSFDFDVFAYSEDDPSSDKLLLLAEAVFDEDALLSNLGVDRGIFRTFLMVVRANYNPAVPFHNFRHAFAVLQQAHALLQSLKIKEKFDDLERFALLVSCVLHDVDHPGLNNMYQKNARTPLALRYHDQAILENHHCAVGLNILESKECGVLQFLPPEKQGKFRATCITLIMSTEV